MFKLNKIISGGQTGADIGALRAARALGFATGGWMPRGFITEAGSMPQYAELYNMRETHSPYYSHRTKLNVEDCDGVVIVGNIHLVGSKLTTQWTARRAKPLTFLSPDHTHEDSANRLLDFLAEFPIETLNVAGNRESVAPGIQNWTESVMRLVLGEIVYHVKGA